MSLFLLKSMNIKSTLTLKRYSSVVSYLRSFALIQVYSELFNAETFRGAERRYCEISHFGLGKFCCPFFLLFRELLVTAYFAICGSEDEKNILTFDSKLRLSHCSWVAKITAV